MSCLTDPRDGPLFKYMRGEHAEAFTHSGTVRVGTLHEYHAIDKLGEEIGDSREGMVFCSIRREDLVRIGADVSPCSALTEWIRNMVRTSPEARFSETFVANYMPRDQYMYCVTEVYGESAMRQFGYDACIRIDDVRSFFACLSQDIAEHAIPVALFRCQYRDRGFRYEEADAIHPESVKTERYTYQKEVRALWSSRMPWLADYHPTENPAPKLCSLLVSDSRLVQFCTRMA